MIMPEFKIIENPFIQDWAEPKELYEWLTGFFKRDFNPYKFSTEVFMDGFSIYVSPRVYNKLRKL